MSPIHLIKCAFSFKEKEKRLYYMNLHKDYII